jgi:hypothetical protein
VFAVQAVLASTNLVQDVLLIFQRYNGTGIVLAVPTLLSSTILIQDVLQVFQRGIIYLYLQYYLFLLLFMLLLYIIIMCYLQLFVVRGQSDINYN